MRLGHSRLISRQPAWDHAWPSGCLNISLTNKISLQSIIFKCIFVLFCPRTVSGNQSSGAVRHFRHNYCCPFQAALFILIILYKAFFVQIGDVVNLSSREEQNFIRAPATEDLLKMLKGETAELQWETEIRLELALQALRSGFSLTEIVQKAVCQLEKYVIAQILKSTNGNKAETARILKVDYKTLYRKMYKYFGTFPDILPASQVDGPQASMGTGLSRKSADLA